MATHRSSTKILKEAGSWVPAKINAYIDRILAQAKANMKNNLPLSQSVQKFYDLVNSNAIIYMYFEKMIRETPPGLLKDHPSYDSVELLMYAIDVSASWTPWFDGTETELLAFPINCCLYYLMATTSGFACFRIDEVNKAFQEILTQYGKYLKSSASCDVLNTSSSGWFCDAALALMEKYFLPGENFENTYVCDKQKEHYGFTSWNDFFTRSLRPGKRPVDPASKAPDVVTSSCESFFFALQENVKEFDTFWIKQQPYSLRHVLNDADGTIAKQFVGGVVYQAFLDAKYYHRWHSPVNGRIVQLPVVIPGSYYSEAESQGLDPGGPNLSEGYLTAVATRGLIYIQAEEPIGLIAISYIGMAECSSCVFENFVPGQLVQKGEEIGHFEYGGSSLVMIFRPNIVDPTTFPKPDKKLIRLNSPLCKAING